MTQQRSTSRLPKAIPTGDEPIAQRGELRGRLAFLLAVLAVPAVAAPGDFGALAGDAPIESESVARELAQIPAMPFEKPGRSFPGSAFYYLADPPKDALIALPTSDPLDSGAEYGRELGALIDAGPAASPFFSAASGLSHQRAHQCMAQAIWYEAASENEAGQRAVAQVVLNRVAHPSWPGTVCGVVYQGSQRSTGCQFSFTCDGSLRRKAGGASWRKAQAIASDALSGSVYAPIGHATHYHTLWVNPVWASSLDHIGTIGAHRFYRNRGPGGEKSAFTGSYAGIEPGVSGRTSAPESSPNAAAPVPPLAVPAAGGPPPTPAATANTPPASEARAGSAANAPYGSVGQVKEEYSRAGQWKKQRPKTLDEAPEDAGSTSVNRATKTKQ